MQKVATSALGPLSPQGRGSSPCSWHWNMPSLLTCQERPQLAHFVELFQCVYPPNDLLGALGTQHRRHQGARLFVQPLGVQRILLRAGGMAREVTDGLAVS